MIEITITEALQEIKTLKQRIIKKRTLLAPYIGRDVRLRDPFEAQGGSSKYIREERQSISDLEKHLIMLRIAIQHTNLVALMEIEGEKRTVADWLTWRREVAPGQREHLEILRVSIEKARQQLQSKGGKLVSAVTAQVNMDSTAPPEFVINLDEQELLRDIEKMEKLLGTLDGKLSLFNATHTITGKAVKS